MKTRTLRAHATGATSETATETSPRRVRVEVTMRDHRPALLALALLTGAAAPAQSGEFVGLRSAYKGFDAGDVAKSTLLEGDAVVDVIRDELGGMLAFGCEYLNLRDRFIYTVSLDYASTELPGNSRSRFTYVRTDSLGNVTTTQVTAASQTARVSVGVGYNLIGTAPAFVYVNPSVYLEWGTRVTLDDAADRLLENEYEAPAELAVDARLGTGLTLRLFTGVRIGQRTSLAISPSCRYGWDVRQRATDDGLDDELRRERALGFDLDFGIYRAITD